jgi:hypothetical protein
LVTVWGYADLEGAVAAAAVCPQRLRPLKIPANKLRKRSRPEKVGRQRDPDTV